ncbi:MAG: cytochrome P450 [Polyangia bacterium]
MRLPPGPSQLGNLFLAPKFLRDPRGPIHEMTARYGLTWRGRIVDQRGVVDLVWLMGPRGNERILSPRHKDDFSWYEGYSFSMESLFGRDILFLLDDDLGGGPGGESGGAHRQRHKLLIPAFHPRLDGAYLPEMAAIIGRYLDGLPTGEAPGEPPGRPVDLQWLIKRVTFHIVTQLLFGAEEKDLAHLTHLFEEVGLGLFALVRWDLPGLSFGRAKRARAELARYIQGRIDWYRSTGATPPTLLGQLMQAQAAAAGQPGGLPDESLIAELLAFLFAGYDTTSSMLTSLLVALGENPAVLADLTDELRQADGSALRRGELPEQPLLDAVLLEAERLYPPLLFAMRGTRADIEHDGYDIPAHTKVAYSPYYTGRMPELFADPLRFDPRRFLGKKPQPYTLLGFGGGHRVCIGKRFAGLEMRLFLNLLLGRFVLTPQPQDLTAVFFNPTLQRKHGYWVTLRPRPGAEPVAA